MQVLASPRIRLLRNFLTAEEAAEMIRIAEPLYHRSPVRSVAQDRRTSSTATLAGGILGNINWAVRVKAAARPSRIFLRARGRTHSPICVRG